MKALTYQGSKDVRVETVPDPVLMANDDMLLRVTATAICGSDLHIYRGKIPAMQDGDILGHEFMGIVEECGSEVTNLKRGDRVVIPFVIPINFDEDDDPADTILKATGGHGVDATIDAVGFEAKGGAIETVLTAVKLEGSSGQALRQCIAATRRGGVISVPGVYAGFIHGFLFGDAFDKGLTFKMGQTHVQRYMPELLEHIGNGKLKPEVIITHRMALADAVKGYEIFEKKEQECRKVVLVP